MRLSWLFSAALLLALLTALPGAMTAAAPATEATMVLGQASKLPDPGDPDDDDKDDPGKGGATCCFE